MIKKTSCLLALWFLFGSLSVRAENKNSPWSQVVMIGASASAGFMVSEPFGGTNVIKCRLSYYVDAAIKPPHPPLHNFANALLFMNPEGGAPLQINAALSEKPTLVVAVDFLFWFCYGAGRDDAERMQRLEGGLKLLDSLKCPLVIGDIPDASYATNTGIISPAQVPSGNARAAANRRLREWAAARPQTVVVPLSDFMSTVMADQNLTIHGETLPAGKSRAILQDDQLHPKPRGAAILALGILDTLTSKEPNFSSNDVRWDSAEVFKMGYEAAKPKPVARK